MLGYRLDSLKQPVDDLLGTEIIEGDLLSYLREDLIGLLLKNGYEQGGGESIADFFERKLAAEGDQPSSELVSAIEIAHELVEDIHRELRADNWKIGEPATRSGISQQEIAQTLREVAVYLKGLNVGLKHNRLADDWLQSGNLPDRIEQADQKELREIFGKGDGQHYWPGKVIPTLIDVKAVLKFQAYRELLDGPNSVAQKLLERIDAFKGTYGSCHLAGTSECHERYQYIKKTLRHKSETYAQPANPRINRANIANFTYHWTDGEWLPVSADEVECRLVLGGEETYSSSDYLAVMKATLEDGFRRGNINARVIVELGITYGEDAVVVSMSTNDYRKFVALNLGHGEFDLTDDTDKHQISGPSTKEHYYGFEQKKMAFYAKGDLMIDTNALSSDRPNAKLIAAKLAWLEESGCLVRRTTTLDDGRSDSPVSFEVLERNHSTCLGRDSFQVDNRYYDLCDLLNAFNAVRRELYDLVNDVASPDRYSRRTTKPIDTSITEFGGRIYTPSDEPYRQVGHHFEFRYGLRYEMANAGNGIPTLAGLEEHKFYQRFFLDELTGDKREVVKLQLLWILGQVKKDIDAGGDGMIGIIDPSRRSV